MLRYVRSCQNMSVSVLHVRERWSKELKFQKERFTLDAVEILCNVSGALMWIPAQGREQSLQNRLNLHLAKMT